jgi:hypothetical protein
MLLIFFLGCYRFRPAVSGYRVYCMQNIFAREWFTRMWTIQELVMAKEPIVMCGKNVIKWRHLVNEFFRAPLSQRSDEFEHALESIWAIDRLRKLSKIHTIPRGKIKNLGNSEAWTTPSQIDQLLIFKSIGWVLFVTMILYVTIRGFLYHGFRLWHWEFDIVAWACTILSLASFLAQNFFPPRSQNTGHMESGFRNNLLSVLNKTRARHTSEPRDKVFALFGVFNELGIGMDDPDYTETVASVFFNFTQRLIKWHDSLDILIEVSFPTLPGSPTWVPDWSKPYPRPCVENYNATGCSRPDFKIGHRELETSGKVVVEIETTFQKPPPSSVSLGPSFIHFTTRKDLKGFSWTGLSPGPVGPGDILTLISGLCVPMILRPSGHSGFKVIGLAIVDGLMQGEAWPGNSSQLGSFKLV